MGLEPVGRIKIQGSGKQGEAKTGDPWAHPFVGDAEDVGVGAAQTPRDFRWLLVGSGKTGAMGSLATDVRP